MRLNMGVLRDELSGVVVGEHLVPRLGMTLAGVRLLDDSSEPSPAYVYVCAAEQLLAFEGPGSLPATICVATADFAEALAAGGRDIIVVDGTRITVGQVLARVLEAFERFGAWERRILQATIEGRKIQEVLDIAHEELSNPIALLDNAQFAIAMSGDLPPEKEETVWDDLTTLGYVSVERYGAYERSYVERLETEREAYIIPGPNHGTHMQMICNIMREGGRIANFGLVDIVEPFTLGQQSLVNHLAAIFLPVIEQHEGSQATPSGLSHIVIRMLSGNTPAEDAVAFQLQQRKWSLDDTYCCLFISNETIDSARLARGPVDIGYLRLQLRNTLPQSCIVSLDDGLLAIVRGTSNQGILESIAHCAPTLEKLHVTAGASMPFRGFRHLGEYFRQASTAERLGAGRGIAISHYGNYVIEDLIESEEELRDLICICHPDVLRLADHDRRHGTDFVGDLYAFLMSGGRASKAAARLYMHRNTFLYHLERIRQLTNLDLDNDGTFLHALMSCVILLRR